MSVSRRPYFVGLLTALFLICSVGQPASGTEPTMKDGIGATSTLTPADKPNHVIDAKPGIVLTDSERSWLAEHQTIRVAFDGYFPPYSFLNDQGKLEGLAVEILRLLATRIGVTIEIFPKTVWNELFEAAQRREVDVVATMGKQPAREEWFVFTRPYIFKSLVVMTQQETMGIEKPADLTEKRVALVENYQYVKPPLEQYPTIRPYYVDTMLDGLNAVAVGKADAAITFLSAGHYLRAKYQIANLKFATIFDRDRYTESIGVRKDWLELAVILDKALDSISHQEMLVLQNRWLPQEKPKQRIPMTVEEQDWLRAHPVIRVGIDPEFVPFEFRDQEGNYIGIAADYLHLLQARLGINFEIIPKLTRTQVMAKARNKEIDLLPCVGRTGEREQFLNFSIPYINSPKMIITRSETPFITGLDDIKSWKVAVQADSLHEENQKTQISIQPTLVATVQEGLTALSGGKIDAFITDIGPAAHWIRKLHITNLKVAAPASEGKLHFAARKDWPLLITIINKALRTLPEEDKDKISQRWIAVEFHQGIARKTIYSYLAVLLTLGLFAALGFTLWNKALKKKVDQKTMELRTELNERRKVESALRQSEQYNRLLFELSPIGLALCRMDGTLVDLNPAYARIIGRSVPETLSLSYWDITPPQYSEQEQLQIQSLEETGSYGPYEKEYIHLDGHLVPVRLQGLLIKRHGETFIWSSVEDISKQKTTEQSLQRNEQVLRIFVEHSPAAIAMFDTEMKYIVASRRFLMDYNLGEQDIIGRSHYEVFPDMPERWREIHRRCLAGAIEKCDEDPFPRADKTMDWVRWEIRPWHETQGEIGGIIVFSEVITNRKQAELELEQHREHLEELVQERTSETRKSQQALLNVVEDLQESTEALARANEQLKEIDRLKSIFIASMSHELRTPLNSVIGFSSVLSNEWAGPVNEEQKGLLTTINRSGKHLLTLINDVIDISKIESGKLDTRQEDFDLQDVINEAVENLSKDAADKQLTIKTDIPHLTMHTDRRRLLQCVLNLLSNALKFTLKGGVQITARNMPEGEQIEITIQDTGIGIKEEDMAKLFQSFIRLDSPLRSTVLGTGLGLYLTKKLARETLGGDVFAESTYGLGSRFTLIIPAILNNPQKGVKSK